MPTEKVDLSTLNLKEYTRCGKYLISNICLQTLPCQHIVINTETLEKTLMSATIIQDLFEAENISNTHFETYGNLDGVYYGPLVGGNGEW